MSRHHARRPVLLPAVRRLWRDPHRLQLGTDPGRAMILELADPACAELLDLLDGTRTETALLRAAVRRGVRAEDASAMLTALAEAGFVLDARSLHAPDLAEPIRRRLDAEAAALALEARRPAGRPRSDARPGAGPQAGRGVADTLRRRLAAQVLITGASHLAVPIAAILASAGVGHLDPALRGVTRLADAAPAG